MTPTCPSCGAAGELVRYRANRSSWFCDSCDHTWAGAAPDALQAPASAPGDVGAAAARPASQDHLRLFLSFGHDASEELVRRIKADLEARGHEVWLD